VVVTDQQVGELVAAVPARARLFERLGIDYCCGGRVSLADACRARRLDPETVAVLLDAFGDIPAAGEPDWSTVSLAQLCDHIVDVHHAFLRRELPRISTLLEKCERAHGLVEPRALFDELRGELEPHMLEEEQVLFPAVRAGSGIDASLVDDLDDEHAAVGQLLQRLSVLTNGYDPSAALCNTHRAALAALADLERDLHDHIHEENNILFPRALA
jgi:regulator of cell morphogenesis and NO signaling